MTRIGFIGLFSEEGSKRKLQFFNPLLLKWSFASSVTLANTSLTLSLASILSHLCSLALSHSLLHYIPRPIWESTHNFAQQNNETKEDQSKRRRKLSLLPKWAKFANKGSSSSRNWTLLAFTRFVEFARNGKTDLNVIRRTRINDGDLQSCLLRWLMSVFAKLNFLSVTMLCRYLQ